MGLDTYITHATLVAFAEEKVNLKSEDVKVFREQVGDLRDRLKRYIDKHPDFNLVKMLHSGSVAKGTALSKINDMDVAVYVKKSAAPGNEAELLNWLADRLREAYGDWKSHDDFEPQTHCVKVKFHGTGLDVDVAPVLYEGDANDKGYLITKDTGQRLLTSIPMHLAFTRKRKESCDPDYRQVIRFIKWWKREQPGDFRFKSFMIELLVAHLYDRGALPRGNYVEALTTFFSYVARTGLKEKIIFTDYYAASQVKDTNNAIQIFDPVNPENNVASQYTEQQRQAIVEAAGDALDAINYARRATTKGEAESSWKEVMGPSFKVTA
jgi:hypothetical protein